MNIIMATRFNIEVNVDEVLHLAHSLTPRAMQNAWRRTLKKTGKYLQSQVAKKIIANRTNSAKSNQTTLILFCKKFR